MKQQGVILAIDPGKHAGLAWFDADKRLLAVCLCDPDEGIPVCPVAECVVEVPCHQHGDTPARTNDLFKTAFRAGRLAERSGAKTIKTVAPHAWKGNVPKDVHNERVLKRLSAEERAIVYGACTQHGGKVSLSLLNNVIDAVGIGLWYVGR